MIDTEVFETLTALGVSETAARNVAAAATNDHEGRAAERLTVASSANPDFLGRRFVQSTAYAELQERGALSGGASIALKMGRGNTVVDRFVSNREFEAILHAAPTDPFRRRHPQRFVVSEAAPARVPGLVEFVPVESTLIPVVRETDRTASAGGVPTGVAAQESELTLTEEDLSLGAWGSAMNVPIRTLRDPGQARAIIERFLREVTLRQLETDMLVGDGSETATFKRLVGITETDGINTIVRDASDGETWLDALARAQEAVHLDDHYLSPLSLVAHPSDLKTIFTEKDSGLRPLPVRKALFSVEQFVPTTALPQGQAVLGAFSAGATLYVEGVEDDVDAGGWSLDISDSHNANFRERLATLLLSNFIAFDVHTPDAFCLVSLDV